MRTRWFARVGLVTVSLCVALAGAELVGRRWSGVEGASLLVNAPNLYDTSIFVPDPELGQVLRPGAVGHMRTPEFVTEVRVNSVGTRGPELGPKASGALRVLAVGDSSTLAVQVDETETFCAGLSRRLTTELGRPVEVVNAGVDGFGTFHAARQAERLATVLDADAILLMFFLGNDIQDNLSFRPEGYPARTQLLPSLSSPIDRIFSWSFLYFHGTALWRARAAAADPGRSARFRAEAVPFLRGADLRTGLEPTRRALSELATRSGGRPVVIGFAPPAFVISPARAEATFALFGVRVEPDLDAPARALLAEVPSGMTAVDLTEPLRRAETAERTYFVFDGHWTRHGHDVVATALTPQLIERLRVR